VKLVMQAGLARTNIYSPAAQILALVCVWGERDTTYACAHTHKTRRRYRLLDMSLSHSCMLAYDQSLARVCSCTLNLSLAYARVCYRCMHPSASCRMP
jgi:hypothetical protein